MNQAVEPELTEIFFWIVYVIYGNQIGAGLPTVFNAAYSCRECSSAVGKCHAQAGQSFKNTTKDHRANGQ